PSPHSDLVKRVRRTPPDRAEGGVAASRPAMASCLVERARDLDVPRNGLVQGTDGRVLLGQSLNYLKCAKRAFAKVRTIDGREHGASSGFRLVVANVVVGM